ncbi:hypothetical protein TMatcc_001959 [Talaromyces marneffei ATCC 18224]|uniref:Mediator of RNA polymerase II transcription subunit 20 n=1 Tax=Talaromyces marneffei (strain ATCC 18224 / CBS 334.59 / QM 7333) TaxID=441960 RepID=B6QIA1_TALMQ|nr:conserved hypothetical protein [Talaromyces marneffei ATCC 18224]KAE8551958.1 hypothetical protein EYB25_005849 [Talaromyces marneffei]
MPHTGVFFIPSSPNAPNILGPLTERLRSVYGDEAIPIGRWGLEHKLMRDTPSCLPASAHAPNPAPRARYVQFLSMTNHPKLGFVYASEDDDNETQTNQPITGREKTESGMIMSTVPIASSSEIFRHFVRCCEPIWCHRHTVTVTGTVYDVGDFRVRLGEVRQTQPQARPRGTIMEVEWRGPSMIADALSPVSSSLGLDKTQDSGVLAMDVDGDIDSAMKTPYIPTESEIQLEYEQISHLIREFWTKIYSSNDATTNNKQLPTTIREAILIPDVGRELKQRIAQRRQPGWQERENRRRRKRREAIALDRSWGGVSEKQQQQQDEEEDDMDAGVDLARQYMELFRFNR